MVVGRRSWTSSSRGSIDAPTLWKDTDLDNRRIIVGVESRWAHNAGHLCSVRIGNGVVAVPP